MACLYVMSTMHLVVLRDPDHVLKFVAGSGFIYIFNSDYHT